MSYKYCCLNPISGVGLEKLTADYERTEDFAAADVAFVRSAKMDEMTGYMISKYTRLRGIEVDIYMRVDRMQDQTEREILRYRYIDGLSWEEISARLNYSKRNVTRIHGRALQHFPMDDVL